MSGAAEMVIFAETNCVFASVKRIFASYIGASLDLAFSCLADLSSQTSSIGCALWWRWRNINAFCIHTILVCSTCDICTSRVLKTVSALAAISRRALHESAGAEAEIE